MVCKMGMEGGREVGREGGREGEVLIRSQVQGSLTFQILSHKPS